MLQDATLTERPAEAKRSIEIHRFNDAKSQVEAGLNRYSTPQSVNDTMAGLAAVGLREGFTSRCLYRSPDPDGFLLMHGWFKSNTIIPPHSHDTDCLYYVISGAISMGDQTLGSGDVLFVPANAVYSFFMGPEGAQFLEFRDVSDFDTNIRPGAPSFWDRMKGVVEANRENWRTETPPRSV